MKRILCITLAISLLLCIFAGCSGDSKASPAPSATPTPDTSAEVSATPDEENTAGSLPIVDEKMTFTIWNGPYSVETGMTGPNDSLAYQKAEELTNIHIEWDCPSQTNLQENFNLILASQTYPDAFMGASGYWIGGYDSYIEDDTIIDLGPMLADNAPNFTALRESDDVVRKWTTTDKGYVPSFRVVSTSREPSWIGIVARQDLIESANYGINANDIETYDEFHDMLVAIKDFASAAPYCVLAAETGMESALMAGYGVNDSYVMRNGKAVFSPTDEGFREYLTMMNQWYSEGLLDPDFYAINDSNILMGALTGGKYVVAHTLYALVDMVDAMIPEPTSNLQGVAPPVQNKGDTRNLTYFNIPHTVIGGSTVQISSACAEPEIFVRWFDYFYSEEGSLLLNWGVENESYIIDAEGNPEWMEFIYTDPDVAAANMMARYASYAGYHPRLYDWARGWTPDMSDRSRTIGTDVWDKNYVESETMPELSVSPEESSEYSSIIGDINTYIEESTVAFIIGSKPLSDWDAYVAQIESMGLSRATQIQQEALDRFLAR